MAPETRRDGRGMPLTGVSYETMLETFDIFKRKHITQNRDIIRTNTHSALRIRELEARIYALESDKNDLRVANFGLRGENERLWNHIQEVRRTARMLLQALAAIPEPSRSSFLPTPINSPQPIDVSPLSAYTNTLVARPVAQSPGDDLEDVRESEEETNVNILKDSSNTSQNVDDFVTVSGPRARRRTVKRPPAKRTAVEMEKEKEKEREKEKVTEKEKLAVLDDARSPSPPTPMPPSTGPSRKRKCRVGTSEPGRSNLFSPTMELPDPMKEAEAVVTQAEAQQQAGIENGRERRARKSVNYAMPKLNTKLRKPDPTETMPAGRARQPMLGHIANEGSTSGSALARGATNGVRSVSAGEEETRKATEDVAPTGGQTDKKAPPEPRAGDASGGALDGKRSGRRHTAVI